MGLVQGIEQEAGHRREQLDEQQRRLRDELAEYAAPLLRLAAEPGVEDVIVNPDSKVWVNRTGEGFRHDAHFSESRTTRVLRNIAHMRGLRFGPECPVLETDDPIRQARITGLCRPLVRGAALAIRADEGKIYRRRAYMEDGILSRQSDPLNQRTAKQRFLELVQGRDHADVLYEAILHRRNIVVSGSTGAGKTKLLNMLLADIGEFCPRDRVVGIEDRMELKWHCVPNHLSMLAARGGPVSPDRCLEVALALKPHRIVFGELRSRRATRALLDAWNTGHSGGIVTVHADDALMALQRLEELLRESARPSIARAIHVVVHMDACDALPVGRKVTQVLLVNGYNLKTKEYEREFV